VKIKGSLAVAGGGPEKVEAIDLAANIGDLICIPCLLKELEEETGE